MGWDGSIGLWRDRAVGMGMEDILLEVLVLSEVRQGGNGGGLLWCALLRRVYRHSY